MENLLRLVSLVASLAQEDRARECIETAGKAVDEAKLTMILVLLSLS